MKLLEEARHGFEAIGEQRDSDAAKRMAAVCLTERGECLRALGRLGEAASAYEESIEISEGQGDERQVAVGKLQLGTVRLNQLRCADALAAYAEARERFTRLGEQGTVASVWHQIGRVHGETGQADAAEDAYRQSLAISVRLGDTAGQASTLTQIGYLYMYVRNRPEEAVPLYRQAAELYDKIGDRAKEGVVCNNLADTLRQLGRLAEARAEIQRSITCMAQFGHAAQPWTSWATLADIETAAEARAKAVAAYLAYRRDGGENHFPDGRLALAVTQALQGAGPAEVQTLLAQVAAAPDLPDELAPFVQALQQICAGSRDPTLADDPALDYSMAAGLLLLIETLPP